MARRGASGVPRTQHRETRQSHAVRAALAGNQQFQSAQQLHGRLRARGDGVGLATVYRTLQRLVEQGEVDVLRTDDGEAIYRLCSREHHHHLTCRSCRRTVEIDNSAVEAWARRIGEENGYADVEHIVELVGTCADCAAS
ncbi:MAG: transcriptional repressor [Actinomycetales bacterium]|nr:transcriptional repressor [Actinomycetales bacterium]